MDVLDVLDGFELNRGSSHILNLIFPGDELETYFLSRIN
jgi:hypothetical protein